jgi:hypothetical protein
MTDLLATMTQAKWDSLTPAQRQQLRDNRNLCPQLIGLEGRKVRVTPKRAYGPSTFRVGCSTGWRPIHLAMRAGAHGSSDVLTARDHFESVTVLD